MRTLATWPSHPGDGGIAQKADRLFVGEESGGDPGHDGAESRSVGRGKRSVRPYRFGIGAALLGDFDAEHGS